MTWLFVATEDGPSEAVAERLVGSVGASISGRFRRNGSGYLRANAGRFLEISRTTPLLLLTDLDSGVSPANLIQSWMGGAVQIPPGFHFVVAVREIESWLMADASGLSAFLGVSCARIPRNPDLIADPKAAMIELAKRGSGAIRRDMVPAMGAVASQGLGYANRLAEFARNEWNIEVAQQVSASLFDAVRALRNSNLACDCCA